MRGPSAVFTLFDYSAKNDPVPSMLVQNLGGHDPEDYQHMVGDPPTELSRFKHSPGYRLILNNVLFPAAEKKKQRT